MSLVDIPVEDTFGGEPVAGASDLRAALHSRYHATRQLSIALSEPLAPEEYRIQSMPDVSPPWWNLGHTTWFFAKNILEPRTSYRLPGRLEYALNSYYETHGDRVPRHQRGLLSSPTTPEVLELRRDVDQRMSDLIADTDDDGWADLDFLVTTGIQHEQQHQELMVTEIKHILSVNAPGACRTYREGVLPTTSPSPLSWHAVSGGLRHFGSDDRSWCWDNEQPRHQAYNHDFEISSRLVTTAEYLEFIEDGGYEDPLLWLANGWAIGCERSWSSPLYWSQDRRTEFTLRGERELDPCAPIQHVSYYEADAYATWRSRTDAAYEGCRLPTEREWEQAASELGFAPETGNLLESEHFNSVAAPPDSQPFAQAAGDLWEWTSSHYEPYPGYRPFEGDLMEYNGKFMDNQRVLRGGSCATPRSHIRSTYRNFWPADTRFQFSGIRLARSI